MVKKDDSAEPKKKKWGQIGAPGSKKRAEYLASIRKNKRNTKQKREEKAAAESKEDIQLIEEPVVDLDLGEENTVAAPPVAKAKAVNTVIVEEQKKMESPGEPGEPYVEYPY